MKYVEMTIPRKEWSEKDDSKVWLFSRLRRGEIPSSPKYIKNMYDALVKTKEETENLKFQGVRIVPPKAPLDEDPGVEMCIHNCVSIVSHVFGTAPQLGGVSKDDEMHFILEFAEKDSEEVSTPPKAIYLVMNRPAVTAGFPVAAFLTLLQAQQYMISAHTSGRPKGVKGLGICEMKLVSEDPVRYAWGDAMLPLARKNKKDCSLLEQGVITLLENEEPVEKDTKGEDE